MFNRQLAQTQHLGKSRGFAKFEVVVCKIGFSFTLSCILLRLSWCRTPKMIKKKKSCNLVMNLTRNSFAGHLSLLLSVQLHIPYWYSQSQKMLVMSVILNAFKQNNHSPSSRDFAVCAAEKEAYDLNKMALCVSFITPGGHILWCNDGSAGWRERWIWLDGGRGSWGPFRGGTHQGR